MKLFVAYTDGSYDMQTLIGASSVVILDKEETEILYQWAKGRKCKFNPEKKQRTNEQELGAIIKAVMSVPKGSVITLYSDSQYAVGVLSGQNEPRANLDLIQKFHEEREKRHVSVDFRWVRGHSGDEYNEMADSLCREVAGMVGESGHSEVIESDNLCFDGLDENKDEEELFVR